MVSMSTGNVNSLQNAYDLNKTTIEQNSKYINNLLSQNSYTSTSFNQNNEYSATESRDRALLTPRIYDALTRIQELVKNGIDDSSIVTQTINVDMAKSGYYLGSTESANASDYANYEDVPSGNFQVYTPPQLSDSQLEDLVNSSAKIGAIAGGSDALFKALQEGSAKIYNQEDMQNILGTPVDWKQGTVSGTMWDRTQVDQEAVQQIQEDGKQIFTSAIGNIHFAVVY